MSRGARSSRGRRRLASWLWGQSPPPEPNEDEESQSLVLSEEGMTGGSDDADIRAFQARWNTDEGIGGLTESLEGEQFTERYAEEDDADVGPVDQETRRPQPGRGESRSRCAEFVEYRSAAQRLEMLRRLSRSTKPTVWLCAGDSLTNGGSLPPWATWVEAFGRHLRSRLQRWQDVVIDLTRPGENLSRMVDEGERRIVRANPDVALLMIGKSTEDSLLGETDADRIATIVEMLLLKGIVPLLQMSPVVGDQQCAQMLRTEIMGVSQEFAVPMIDHYGYWEMSRRDGAGFGNFLLTESGMPSRAGHRQIARLLQMTLGFPVTV